MLYIQLKKIMSEKELGVLKEKLDFVIDDIDRALKLLGDYSNSSWEEDEVYEICDNLKTGIYEIFDIGVYFNISFEKKYREKYLKDYTHSCILRILYNSYELDGILDEKEFYEGMNRIEEFVADFNKSKKFLRTRLDINKIEIMKLQDFINSNKIN
jgi:hypothetical protein